MGWKDVLNGLEKFSEQADVKTLKLARERARITTDSAAPKDVLLAKYSTQVAEVYKLFAGNVGGKYHAAREGTNSFASIFDIEDIEGADYLAEVNIFPEVRILSPWGVIVEVPSKAENAAGRCQKVIEKWSNLAEGYYAYRFQDHEGGWINAKGYFIPFAAFTQAKLAQTLADFYKEAMTKFLKEIKE
jgi:hypothetical protein